jgi:glycosyltransferase involved in cell wall biosynthesis
MGLVIDFITNDGSPLGVTEQSIIGLDSRNGVGGAELALLTVCRGLHDKGHKVTVYNNPTVVGGSVFEHKNLDEFNPQAERDILIVFRSPNERAKGAKGKKIWWSCDQYTIGDFRAFAQHVDKIVCISPFHANYFKTIYGIRDVEVIDIPVRTWEYNGTETKTNSCIFTSVPDRGLMALLPIWDRIVEQVPDASLTITSDWSLWSGQNVSGAVSPYRLAWAGKKNVTYKGAVKREELVKIQSAADYHLYPCTYEELFCISVAESQVAGATPITSRVGALETTNRFGYKIDGNPTSQEFQDRFVETTVKLMTTMRPVYNTKKEFSLDTILLQWESLFNG